MSVKDIDYIAQNAALFVDLLLFYYSFVVSGKEEYVVISANFTRLVLYQTYVFRPYLDLFLF